MPPITPSPTDIPDDSENVSAGNSDNTAIQLSDSDSLSDSEAPDHYGYAPLSQDPENVFVNEKDDEDCSSGNEMEDSVLSEANNLNLCSHHGGSVGISSYNTPSTAPPMDEEHIETIKSVMKGIKLPTSNLPPWADQVPEEEWKAALLAEMQKREIRSNSNSTGNHSKISVDNSQCDLSCEVLR